MRIAFHFVTGQPCPLTIPFRFPGSSQCMERSDPWGGAVCTLAKNSGEQLQLCYDPVTAFLQVESRSSSREAVEVEDADADDPALNVEEGDPTTANV